MKTLLLTICLVPCVVFADPQYPLLQPYQQHQYGLGVHSDAAGRPFHWQTQQGQPVSPITPVQPNVYGPGIGMDAYGRPVYPRANY